LPKESGSSPRAKSRSHSTASPPYTSPRPAYCVAWARWACSAMPSWDVDVPRRRDLRLWNGTARLPQRTDRTALRGAVLMSGKEDDSGARIGSGCAPSRLPLRELEALAGLLVAVLLPFDHPRVPGEELAFAEGGLEVGAMVLEGPGHAELHRAGLAV